MRSTEAYHNQNHQHKFQIRPALTNLTAPQQTAYREILTFYNGKILCPGPCHQKSSRLSLRLAALVSPMEKHRALQSRLANFFQSPSLGETEASHHQQLITNSDPQLIL